MSKKITCFGASNSKNSINKQLAFYAANRIDGADVNLLDLNDFEMPLYGVDYEEAHGIPQLAYNFRDQLASSDGVIVSFAEHNGAYSAAFKNVFDWVSRFDMDVWTKMPLFLMATSPGGRGGQTVLDIAFAKFSYMSSQPIGKFSLPSFYDHFSKEDGITNSELLSEFNSQLSIFTDSIS